MVPLYAARVQDLGPGANHRATCPDRGTIDAYGFAPRLPEVHTSSWLRSRCRDRCSPPFCR